MQYSNIRKGQFISRPNRFIARIDIDGAEEIVHVKNTGRCAELLIPGTDVYVQDSLNLNPMRKTRWDLICVRKGDRMINMDSQVPNKVVGEWLSGGGLFPGIAKICPEHTYGNSRIDFYVEAGERKILIEVKGVTLEENGAVRFPDAPSGRAVKHVEELCRAVGEGYEAYVFFVIQMKGARFFMPNDDTHPQFGEALRKAVSGGVKVLAYDCEVAYDSIRIADEVPVLLKACPEGIADLQSLKHVLPGDIIRWYKKSRRSLPWRGTKDPYHIWVSEIMLQQTRVEAVKPYYERFLQEFPTVKALAKAPEDRLLKLWEGLGYYNRARNMQKAAKQIVAEHQGEFPGTYEEIRSLAGIGDYTAGAISSFAYGIAKPAVDGNVLRVITRITGEPGDIMKQGTRKRIEEEVRRIIPGEACGDFNQGLIELGALVCVPNGDPVCAGCPAAQYCAARIQGRIRGLPVKTKKKARRIEERTVLVFYDEEKVAIGKRPEKGLLAGLYELPSVPGHLSPEEAAGYCKSIGLAPVRIQRLPEAKHIFSHVEWHMAGYRVQVDELERTDNKELLFIRPEEIQKEYPIPSAFEKYMPYC